MAAVPFRYYRVAAFLACEDCAMYEGFGTPQRAFPTGHMMSEHWELIDYLDSQDKEHPVRKTHRLEMDRYASEESKFFFTLCAHGNGKPFENPSLANAIIESLIWRKNKHNWTLFCYCLMPDHLHFVSGAPERQSIKYDAGVQGVIEKGFLQEIAEFKSYTTRIWWKHGGKGQLWQKSSYDHVFRYNESMQKAAWYVLNNPVRKGLVDQWEDYPYAAIVDSWE